MKTSTRIVASLTLMALWIGLGGIAAWQDDAPIAAKKPVEHTIHGDTRVDEYAWIREKSNPEVIAYLEAENEYAAARLAHTETLQETLYQEMIGRLKQTDLSVPYRDGPYFYYSRTVEGLDYPISCRKLGSLEAEEEIILDINELSADHEYFRVTSRAISTDHRWLAYSVDTTGYETVSICIKDLTSGETKENVITEASPFSLVWAADNTTLFYGRMDEAKRTNRIYRHTRGTDTADDVLVRREDDVIYGIGVRRTRSDDIMLISSNSSTTSEVWYVDAHNPTAEFKVIAPRRKGVQYSVDHRPASAPGNAKANGGQFYIVTDADESPNYKLVTAPVDDPGSMNWTTLIAHDPEVLINSISVFARHMVLSERRDGYTCLEVRCFADGESHLIELPETVSTVRGSTNVEFDIDTYRFGYTSLITPRSIFDYDVNTRQRTLLKQTEVLGGYDPDDYVTGRLFATAPDGVKVPISIIHRKGVTPNGENPCLLYGYGSYGASMDPRFNSTNVSLLDRGFVYAIGHVRGGSEMGRHWKETGNMLNKRNTFTDFIACAEHLIETGYTNSDRLAIRGGSAGGLLIGAVLNMRPDLFEAAHAAVPFVDVVNTMLDASIPLTTGEYEEWGNPNVEKYYTYMKSYSPYDNVVAQDYPHLLITAGLNDPRVHYWEPTKWAARLRDRKTDDNLLLLKTNMGAGHGGASGRYGRYRELAFEYAFIIDRVGVPSTSMEQAR